MTVPAKAVRVHSLTQNRMRFEMEEESLCN